MIYAKTCYRCKVQTHAVMLVRFTRGANWACENRVDCNVRRLARANA